MHTCNVQNKRLEDHLKGAFCTAMNFWSMSMFSKGYYNASYFSYYKEDRLTANLAFKASDAQKQGHQRRLSPTW